MKERIRASLIGIYKLLDLGFLAVALWIAFYFGSVQGTDYIYDFYRAPQTENLMFLAGVLVSWAIVLSSFWLYRSKRLTRWEDELFEVLQAVGFCTLVLATLILLAEWHIFPKRFLLIFAVSATILMFSARILKRRMLKSIRLYGRNLRSVVVIGAGARGRKIVEMIERTPEVGYLFAGYIDDFDAPQVIGNFADMPRILAENVIDEVIICLPIKTYYEQIETIVKTAEEQGIIVRIHSDLFNLNFARTVAGELGETPVLSLHTTNFSKWQGFLKNALDFAGSSILLIILSPLMLLVALLIKFDSKGPIFFIQERVGLNKRRFKMFKFRTMVVDAVALQRELEARNEANGPVFKMKNDPRITKIGKWLRKTSLDELPQLFNVVLGDLSLVGPRPLPERDFKKFDQFWFNRRFSVKPGITCIWQISGRSETSFDKWIRQDLEYIDEWSLAMDLKILMKTIPAVLRGTGAM